MSKFKKDILFPLKKFVSCNSN